MEESGLDLTKYLNLILKYKYLIIITLIIFSSIGFVFYKYEIPVFTTKAYLNIEKETLGSGYDITYVQKVDSIITFASSYPFVSSLDVTKPFFLQLDNLIYPVCNRLNEIGQILRFHI